MFHSLRSSDQEVEVIMAQAIAKAFPVNSHRVRSVRYLDHLGTQDLCSGLTVYTPTDAEISILIERAKAAMPILASTGVIQTIARSNPDCFWAIRRAGRAGAKAPSGFVAFLMLNEKGYTALLDGCLKTADPDPAYLVGQHEAPVAIYVWALFVKKLATPALSMVMDKLQSPNYRAANFVARAATEEGAAFLRALGFLEARTTAGLSFYHYKRTSVDSHMRRHVGRPLRRNRPRVTARPVHNFEEFTRVLSVRSAVYVGQERCPFDEEFDGNDFSATHILGTVDGEPVGSLRVRFFADFAKLERLAVREEWRGLGMAREIVLSAIELCRCKGYEKLYIHAREDKTAFWERFGFAPCQTPVFRFSDHPYLEMTAALARHDFPITLGLDPFVLLRAEGSWTMPGALEFSSLRDRGDRHGI